MNPKQKRVVGKPFTPGNGGRPKGSRNKLGEDFFRALSEDFAEHGLEAIVKVRQMEPASYLNVLARLMPKEIKIKPPLGDLSDDDLASLIAAIRGAITAAGGAPELGAGAATAPSRATLN